MLSRDRIRDITRYNSQSSAVPTNLSLDVLYPTPVAIALHHVEYTILDRWRPIKLVPSLHLDLRKNAEYLARSHTTIYVDCFHTVCIAAYMTVMENGMPRCRAI
ncbi:hypothetical protein A0H81_05018 [Grifola frondosa]|uniref:Uncharacterized protein n=1 Tax=Grifola frondosa TaxID=5627 RepID=A0A1C7MFQ1_GRIFR|nr:hypothetical protein A0H81_05018 [Grifola frondosa]